MRVEMQEDQMRKKYKPSPGESFIYLKAATNFPEAGLMGFIAEGKAKILNGTLPSGILKGVASTEPIKRGKMGLFSMGISLDFGVRFPSIKLKLNNKIK